VANKVQQKKLEVEIKKIREDVSTNST